MRNKDVKFEFRHLQYRYLIWINWRFLNVERCEPYTIGSYEYYKNWFCRDYDMETKKIARAALKNIIEKESERLKLMESF